MRAETDTADMSRVKSTWRTCHQLLVHDTLCKKLDYYVMILVAHNQLVFLHHTETRHIYSVLHNVLVLVPDPKPTPAQTTFSIVHGQGLYILEAIYVPDEVWE